MVSTFFKTYRPVLVLAVVAAFAEAAYAAINMLALQVFVNEVLNLTFYLGAILGTFLIVEALMKSVMGALADRYGRWKFLAIAPVVSGCTAFLVVFLGYVVRSRLSGGGSSAVEYHGAGSVLLVLIPLLVIRAIDGVAAAAFWPTIMATMADAAPEHRRTSSISFLTVAYMVGVALGPPLAGWANEKSPLARRGRPTVTQVELLTGSDAQNRRGYFLQGRVTAVDHRARTLTVGQQRFWINPKAKVLEQGPGGSLEPGTLRPATLEQVRPGQWVGVQAGNKAAGFVVVGILFMVTAVVSFLLVPRKMPVRAHSEDGHDQPIRLSDLTVVLRENPSLVVTAMVVFAAVGSLAPVAPLYAKEVFDLSDTKYSQLFVLPAMVIGALTLPIGLLGDRWGRSRSVHVGIGMAFSALLLMASVAMIGGLAQFRTEKVVAALATLLGLGFVMGLPAWVSSVAEIAGEGRRAQMIGAVGTAEGLGAFVGGLISPMLYAKKDVYPGLIHAPMVMACIFLGIGFLIALVTIRPHVGPPEAPDQHPITDEVAELITGVALPDNEGRVPP